MRSVVLTLLLMLASAAMLACDRTAELIPGAEETPSPLTSPPGTVTHEPVIQPASIRISGSASADPVRPAGPSDADLARSVVQVRVIDPDTVPPFVRDGSGVIVDEEAGLILTSALIVVPPGDRSEDRYEIQVATNPVPGGEPRLTHGAVLVAYDAVSNLAVLRLAAPLSDSGVPPAADNDADQADEASDDAADQADGAEDDARTLHMLDEPEAAIGDATAMKRGDQLRMFGHPGLHPSGAHTPQAVMVTIATLVGVRAEPAAGEHAWFTTEARLPHGNAGGPVFNEAGELVGISTQLIYGLNAPVSHVRPIGLAQELIEEAREAGKDTPSPTLPLMHRGGAPGTALPGVSSDITVTEPRFALEALGEGGSRALFDYARVFPAVTPELNYEFVVQGAPDGAPVQELWYLDGVFQDDLSTSYNWSLGPFALVSDRLASPNPAGPPTGVWKLEVWINGSQRAASRAYLGVDPPSPSISDFAFGTKLSQTFGPAESPRLGADRVLAFFAYRGASLVERLSWIVYLNGQPHYRSPEVPWRGGQLGVWWVGMHAPDGLERGLWQFEIFFDGESMGRDSFRLP